LGLFNSSEQPYVAGWLVWLKINRSKEGEKSLPLRKLLLQIVRESVVNKKRLVVLLLSSTSTVFNRGWLPLKKLNPADGR